MRDPSPQPYEWAEQRQRWRGQSRDQGMAFRRPAGEWRYQAFRAGVQGQTPTRTLAWLLNPAESHGFGNRLLKALLRQLHGPDMALNGVIVRSEQFCGAFGCDDAGRADIWIEGRFADCGTPWLVVIEAKVDASESTGQLARYDSEIGKRSAGCVHRVFLTPDGRPPEGGNGQWKPVSFAELVRWFWSEGFSLHDKPGYDFLRYYLAGVMRDILDLPTGNSPGGRNRYRLIGFLKAEGEAHGAG